MSSNAVAVAAAKTSTGNQDITTADLGGLTPKAVFFIYSRSTADGVIGPDAGESFGATDGISQLCGAHFVKSGVVAQSCSRVGKLDKCITAIKWAVGVASIHSEAEYVAFIPNGVRINWTTASADGYLLTALFFAGANWDVLVGHSLAAANPGTAITMPFQPNAVMVFGAIDLFPGVINVNRAKITIGATAFSPAGVRSAQGRGTWAWINTHQEVLVAYSATLCGNSFELFSTYGIGVTQRADGFNLIGLGVAVDMFGYLALKWKGAGRPVCGSFTMPTGTGTKAITGFAGEPGVFMMLQTYGAGTSSINHWQFGNSISTLTKTGSNAIGGFGTNPLYSISGDDSIVLVGETGSLSFQSTLTSFDTAGITLDVTTGLAASHYFGYFTIIDSGAETPSERLFGTVID